VETGNLLQQVDVESEDEIGELEQHFNAMTENLRAILNQVDNGARSMGQSAFQIATISHEISDIGKNEQKSSNEVKQVTDKLVHISQTVQGHAEAATDQARLMSQQATEGVAAVERNLAIMNDTIDEVRLVAKEVNELSQTATKINIISSTITEIASKTNLLALNAAIEAARAGESGRGFAVVADEVQLLASSTTTSSNEIASIIQSLQNGVGNAASAMERVANRVEKSGESARGTVIAFEAMGQEVSTVVNGNEAIAMQSREQIETLSNLQITLSHLFDTLQSNSTKTQVTADIGDSLYGLTGEMNNIISNFTFREEKEFIKDDGCQRSMPRLESNLIINIEQSGKNWEGLSEDISLEGIQVQLSTPLLEDVKDINLSIRLPSDQKETYKDRLPLLLPAKIRWHKTEDKKYFYGIQFNAISSNDLKYLEEIFYFYNSKSIYL
jgi:methyl-accepting chemotaxis protein